MKKTPPRMGSLLAHAVLILFSVPMIYPVVLVLLGSLKSQRELYVNPWGLPKVARFLNYTEAWSIGKIGDYYVNSIIVALGALLLIVVIAYLASHALARMRFRGRDLVMILFVSTMMLPIQITIIPIYKIEKAIGIMDTLIGLILPYVAKALPFSIFVLTAFLKTLPIEFDEAARIDGAGRLCILSRIIFPLSRPGLASILIINFMSVWNDFYLPLVLIHDPSKRTLNLGLINFSQLWGLVDFTRLFAALVIVSLPLVLVYIVFQRQFINGMTSGGLKV
jgi:ABC-type glycerol-3-phosphate transport system permease component